MDLPTQTFAGSSTLSSVTGSSPGAERSKVPVLQDRKATSLDLVSISRPGTLLHTIPGAHGYLRGILPNRTVLWPGPGLLFRPETGSFR